MTSASSVKPLGGKIRVGLRQAIKMIVPYCGSKFKEQIKSVWLIILYLVLFLRLVLGISVANALLISVGIGGVIVGLTFFIEGLLLGLMPLGEVIGLKLPQKSKLPVILVFSLILGIGATFAEPAINILKAAGSSVYPWNAPLLFILLNKYSSYLVCAIAIGVGIAVMAGILRFIYNLSLKPFIYTTVGSLSVLTLFAAIDPNLRTIIGLAWDCGGITTGPVTVPLVIALGIGICRVVGKAGSGSACFGVVTLASLLPVITVLILGMSVNNSVPSPMTESQFFSKVNHHRILTLFKSRDEALKYAFWNTNEKNQAQLFEGGRDEMLAYLHSLAGDELKRREIFGADPEAIFRWAVQKGSEEQRAVVFKSEQALLQAVSKYSFQSDKIKIPDLLGRNGLAAAQAVIPLTLFLLSFFVLIIREKLPRADEIVLGIVFALIGMMLFNIGIEIGLGTIGNQVGGKLPALFKNIQLPDQSRTIINFDKGTVQTAVTPEGEKQYFFYIRDGGKYETVPFQESGYDRKTGRYTFIPTKGPLFGEILPGIIVLLIFSFILGYGATLAEPALNALGHTVEKLTVGTFKKSFLMQAVAVGVGIGIVFGVAKIIWNLPLVWLLLPPYILLMIITWMSTEEFVNIGWDSAGVTTGPVTVPLVLAMGLGIGNQIGVVEGFGILAMASVCPILSVLTVGLFVARSRKAELSKVTVVSGGDGK
jgi:hypothetical protein